MHILSWTQGKMLLFCWSMKFANARVHKWLYICIHWIFGKIYDKKRIENISSNNVAGENVSDNVLSSPVSTQENTEDREIKIQINVMGLLNVRQS